MDDLICRIYSIILIDLNKNVKEPKIKINEINLASYQMNSRKNEIYQKDLQLKDSKTKKANNVIYIQNIEGSQEKTVFELISDQTTEIKINNNITITTSESFEPSIADEVNYDPQNTTNELDFIEANLDVNEGTNEHNFNLVNKIKESQIKQIQVLSNSKFLKTYNRTR